MAHHFEQDIINDGDIRKPKIEELPKESEFIKALKRECEIPEPIKKEIRKIRLKLAVISLKL